MSIDPNVYALNIQLQLDAQEAFTTLDKFGTVVSSVEEKIAEVADKTLHGISDIVGHIASSLTNVWNLSNLIGTSADNISLNFKDVNKSIVDTQQTNEDELDNLLKRRDYLEDITESIVDTQQTNEDELDNLLKRRDYLEDITEFYDQIGDTLNDHVKLLDSDLNLLNDIREAIKLKNRGHYDQNEHMHHTNELWDQSAAGATRNANLVTDIRNLWHGLYGTVSSTIGLFRKVDEGTEAFVQTNYRAYGSQQLLLQSTRQLTMELGVSEEAAIATYKALADFKTPIAELNKYAKMVAIANRTTGVSTHTIANYTKSLRLAGLSLDQIERNITYTTEAMRKFGLNQDDVNKLMNTSSGDMLKLKRIFGGSAEEVSKFKETITVFAGVARSIGASTDAAISLQQHLTNPVNHKILEAMTGVTINNMDDMRVAIMKGGEQLYNLDAKMKDLKSRGIDVTSLAIEYDVLSEKMFGSSEAGAVAAATYEKVKNELKLAGKNANDFAEVAKVLAKIQADQLAEANNTLTGQLIILSNTFGAVTGAILQFVADGLFYFVYAINTLLYPIREFSAIWIDVMGWLNKSIPGFQILTAVVKIFTAGLVLLGSTLFGLVTTTGLFSFQLTSLGASIGLIGTIFTRMMASLATAAQGFSQVLIVVFSSIGRGLTILGATIRPVMVPLLALSASLVLTAAASWLFVESIKSIVNIGFDAIPAVIGLTASIGALGLVLVGLGTLAQGPIAVGILVIGAALMMAGVSASLMGSGLLNAAKGMSILSGVITPETVFNLSLFGLSLVALGSAAIFAVPGLIVLGSALMVVSSGISIFGAIFEDLSAMMDGFDSNKLLKISNEFLMSSQMLIIAAGLASTAAVLIMSASLILLPASTMMVSSSSVLLAAGLIYSNAAGLMLSGSNKLYPASSMLSLSGSNILSGASSLFLGSSLLISGAGVLMASASLLAPAGLALLSSALILNVGMITMMPLSRLILSVGAMIAKGGNDILVGLKSLYTASGMISNIGALFGSGSARLMVIAPMIMAAALILYPASRLLYSGSNMLHASGVMMQSAGSNLLSGSTSLISSSSLISQASSTILSSGSMLLPGSYMLYNALSWLDIAISKFDKSSSQIKNVSESVLRLSSAFITMKDIPINKLKELSDGALSALPGINKLSSGISQSSIKLSESTRQFARPANDLINIFGNLNSALSEFSSGVELSDDIGKLATMMDDYAGLLEGTTDRIETAIQTRAIPAMRSAEKAGLKEAVQSEAITTVQVLNKSEGDTANPINEMIAISSAQLLMLKDLCDKVSILQSGNNTSMSDILNILQKHLPNISRKDDGLATQFNSWMN